MFSVVFSVCSRGAKVPAKVCSRGAKVCSRGAKVLAKVLFVVGLGFPVGFCGHLFRSLSFENGRGSG